MELAEQISRKAQLDAGNALRRWPGEADPLRQRTAGIGAPEIDGAVRPGDAAEGLRRRVGRLAGADAEGEARARVQTAEAGRRHRPSRDLPRQDAASDAP